MHRTYRTIAALVALSALLSEVALAAVPNASSYQGLLLDPTGQPVSGNVTVIARIYNDPTSTAPADLLYAEVHVATPVVDGVFDLALGEGSLPSGAFDATTFAGPDTWLELEVDSEVLSPRQKFHSVPYALQAQQCVDAQFVDGQTWQQVRDSALNVSLALVGTSLQLTDAGGTLGADLGGLIGDPDSLNELQTLSQVGEDVTLSLGGGSVSVADADADPTNELNTGLDLVGSMLEVTDAGGSLTLDLSSLDVDATNELNQSAALNGTTLEITDPGGTVDVDLGPLVDSAATAGETVAIHLHRGFGGTQYIVPAGKLLVIEHILFNETWENSSDPMELIIQHSTNPSGPVWNTKERYFTGLNTLLNPLVLPAGKAALAPFLSPNGQILHKVFLYGRLIDDTEGTHVAIHLHRGSGGTQYIVPVGKMLIIDHILFNETWENASDPLELIIQHSTNPSGPVWNTKETYGTGLNTLFQPLVLPAGKAALAPFLSPSGQILHKVFLYGRLVDAGAYPLSFVY